jgi:hypothetical protein
MLARKIPDFRKEEFFFSRRFTEDFTKIAEKLFVVIRFIRVISVPLIARG